MILSQFIGTVDILRNPLIESSYAFQEIPCLLKPVPNGTPDQRHEPSNLCYTGLAEVVLSKSFKKSGGKARNILCDYFRRNIHLIELCLLYSQINLGLLNRLVYLLNNGILHHTIYRLHGDVGGKRNLNTIHG